MQVSEEFEDTTYVANRLMKTMFPNFDKFMDECNYVDERPFILIREEVRKKGL
jgi:hypothetical protein